jgi:hypothetical protein
VEKGKGSGRHFLVGINMIRFTKEDLKNLSMQFEDQQDFLGMINKVFSGVHTAFDDEFSVWMHKFVIHLAEHGMTNKWPPDMTILTLFVAAFYLGALIQESKDNPQMTVHLKFHK